MPKNIINPKSALGYKSANKDRRKKFHIEQKKARDALRRDERLRRKREENKNPELRRERQLKNKPRTIDSKRKWDDAIGEDEADDMLGKVVDLEHLSKRKRTEELESLIDAHDAQDDDEADSMLEDSDEEDPEEGNESDDGLTTERDQTERDQTELDGRIQKLDEDVNESELEDADNDGNENEDDDQPDDQPRQTSLAPSVAASAISTTLDLAPEALLAKFPSLFNPNPIPKVLVTTGLNSTLHDQARLLATLFPNSTYVRRSAHHFAHKYSVTEIASFASNRGFTTLIVMNEDQKRPCGMDIVHLPNGPMFHFSMTNWIEGKKMPGHGNPTGHNPEIILRGFRTPLGVLTASVLRTMMPANPELQGRQVVTFHNQRDFIFVRRHRYVFRDKRKTEKSALEEDGSTPMKGVEDLKVGLQELGPRFTLKLRRVDKGIQRKSGQLWEWKGKTDKIRTKFQL